MLKDTLIEQDSNWGTRVGPDIGGVPPTTYGMRLHPLETSIREFYVQDPPWANWLAYSPRKILPNTGQLNLAFDLFVDDSSLKVAQAIEFDTKLSFAGFMYNFSSQFNYQTGLWQISGQDDNWHDTTFRFGKFVPGVKHHLEFYYTFNVSTRKYSFLGVTVDQNIYLVPANLQNLIAFVTDWKETCNIQIQQDLNGNGGAFSVYARNIEYKWR